MAFIDYFNVFETQKNDKEKVKPEPRSNCC